MPLHTHRWPGVQYFLSLGDFVRRDDRGVVVVDTRTIELPPQRPLVLWSEPTTTHTLENVGADPIHVIVVESKEASPHPVLILGRARPLAHPFLPQLVLRLAIA